MFDGSGRIEGRRKSKLVHGLDCHGSHLCRALLLLAENFANHDWSETCLKGLDHDADHRHAWGKRPLISIDLALQVFAKDGKHLFTHIDLRGNRCPHPGSLHRSNQAMYDPGIKAHQVSGCTFDLTGRCVYRDRAVHALWRDLLTPLVDTRSHSWWEWEHIVSCGKAFLSF